MKNPSKYSVSHQQVVGLWNEPTTDTYADKCQARQGHKGCSFFERQYICGL